MAKKKKNVAIESATSAALQWHFGIVTEPPSDRVGKEYLAQHLPKRYQLEGDTLIVKKTGLSVAPKQLAANQAKAKKTFQIVRAELSRGAASKQASENRPKEAELVEDPYQSLSSSQLELSSTPHAVASSTTPAPQAPVTVSDELWASEDSLPNAYSSFTINDRPAAFEYQLAFLSDPASKSNVAQLCDNDSVEASRNTPIFSGKVLEGSKVGTFNQYGLLCKAVATRKSQHPPESTTPKPRCVCNYDPRIFLNVNAPWSTFICGSQGSGKSYTLSCILENCLIPSGLGQLPSPLAAIVFHYDTFTSYGSRQLCEAAYLCSSGVPVKVLVSPTNFWRMKQMYENLPLSSPSSRKPEVIPMKFQDKHLDVTRMMSMMAVSDKDGPIPLYVILRILREMAVESQGAPGLDYDAFRKKVDAEAFTGQQIKPLKLRLELLESFMDRRPSKTEEGQQAPTFPDTKAGRQARSKWFLQKARERSIEEQSTDRAWDFKPGTLTIVDLSCPFVDESSACALFSICLDLFLESRNTASRIVALDEAHKFMTPTASATAFTDKLLQLIRQQRHLATRVVISTQEPTISPRLLDLCTVTIVHRFTSPEWFRTLCNHLAGVSTLDELGVAAKRDVRSIFVEIVELEPGEALMFSPSAMLEVEGEVPKKLGMEWLKVRVRRRLTEDGGKSILAT
ncbi:MAG: hypothetical protein Q9188_007448 [Gyalolechia gomerana]